MKASFFSLFAFATSFSTVLSTPVTAPSALLSKRVDLESLITDLYATVQSHTSVINATAASLSPTSSQAEKDAAGTIFTEQLADINSAVVAATNAVKSSSKSKHNLEERQGVDVLTLAGILENVLLDISGALNNIIADLGLTETLAFLGPLVGSLSGLLLSLDVVVDQLLAVVKQLVDGLLIGLSLALAGLVL